MTEKIKFLLQDLILTSGDRSIHIAINIDTTFTIFIVCIRYSYLSCSPPRMQLSTLSTLLLNTGDLVLSTDLKK